MGNLMFDQIIDALCKRSDFSAWSIRHIQTRGTQLYAVPKAVESRREVVDENYIVTAYRQTHRPDETHTQALCRRRLTLLPSADTAAMLDAFSLMAGLASHP